MFEAFRQGLGDLEYVEGQNIVIESRWDEGKHDRMPALAAGLVRLKVDCIVVAGSAATRAAQQATRTTPDGRRRSSDDQVCRQFGAPGRKHHGLELRVPGGCGERAGAAQGGHAPY